MFAQLQRPPARLFLLDFAGENKNTYIGTKQGGGGCVSTLSLSSLVLFFIPETDVEGENNEKEKQSRDDASVSGRGTQTPLPNKNATVFQIASFFLFEDENNKRNSNDASSFFGRHLTQCNTSKWQ